MVEVAYIFERFPSFGQTFCYREVLELERQGARLRLFSIRRPTDGPIQDWDPQLVDSVHYLPDEASLLREVNEGYATGRLPEATRREIEDWGKATDFLRLYQAAYIGMKLQEEGPRRVHAHFAGMAARTAFWIRKFFGIPFSFTAHANDIFAPNKFAIDLEKLMESASAIVTVSDFAVSYLRERYPASADRIHRVYNGIVIEQFASARSRSEPPLILGVGRLIEKKGFAHLIEACDELRKRENQFRCEIIGEGPLEGELRAQIDRLQLATIVALTGSKSQTEIAERLAAASVFVLPCVIDAAGDRDNLPTVIMEAMAAGLPVVSTLVGGVPEMVAHDATGILVPPGDFAVLAGAIERLLADPDRARRFGEQGRTRARELFSVEKTVRQLSEVLAR